MIFSIVKDIGYSFVRSLCVLGINVKVIFSPTFRFGIIQGEPGTYHCKSLSSFVRASQTVSLSPFIKTELLSGVLSKTISPKIY